MPNLYTPYRLTLLEKLVCDEYSMSFNLAQAFNKALVQLNRDELPSQKASPRANYIINKPHCQKYLKSVLAIETPDILSQVISISQSDITDFYDFSKTGDIKLKKLDDLPLEKRQTIQSIHVKKTVKKVKNSDGSETTTTLTDSRISLYPKMKALELLVKLKDTGKLEDSIRQVQNAGYLVVNPKAIKAIQDQSIDTTATTVDDENDIEIEEC